MTYEEFKRQVGRAGLTIVEFAALLEKSRASITNYGQIGFVPDHLAVIVVLMGDMADAGLDFRPSVKRLKLERKLARGLGFGERGDEEG